MDFKNDRINHRNSTRINIFHIGIDGESVKRGLVDKTFSYDFQIKLLSSNNVLQKNQVPYGQIGESTDYTSGN
jgi:hypothetical protein